MVSSDTESPNSSCSRMIRSQARQRTTPWIAGIGPSSTIRRRKALCMSSSLGGAPGEGIAIGATVRPLPLNRITQSQQRLGDPSDPTSLLLTRQPRRSTADQAPEAFALAPILRALRNPPNLTGRVVRPNRHRLAHGKHPSFANLESCHRQRFGNPPEVTQSEGWYKPVALGPEPLRDDGAT